MQSVDIGLKVIGANMENAYTLYYRQFQRQKSQVSYFFIVF